MTSRIILESEPSEDYFDGGRRGRRPKHRARRSSGRVWIGRLLLIAIPLAFAAAVAAYLFTRGPDVSAANLTNVDQGQLRDSLDDAPDPAGQTATSIASSSVDADPNLFWVDPTSGDNENDGQTIATAWSSLQTALDELQPGQTVHLMSGVYNETLEPGNAHYIMSNGGTEDAWITIKAAPGEQPSLVANAGNALELRGSYVEVSGLHIVGDGFGVDNPYGWGVLIRGAHHVRVKGNNISQMPVGGITTVDASNTEILYNVVFENSFWGTEQGSGISVWHARDLGFGPAVDGYHDAIIGNTVYRNENKVFSRWVTGQNAITDGNGIIIDATDESGYTGRMLVANNVVFDNGGRGILVNEASRVDIVHNTTYQNGRTEGLLGGKTELGVARSADVKILDNLAWSLPGAESMRVTDVDNLIMGGNVFVTDVHTGPDTELDLVVDADPGLANISTDPALIDLRPIAGSLLLGRAIPTSPHVPFDANLNSRPVDGATVGAYEPGG